MSEPWKRIVAFSNDEPGEEADRIIYLSTEALRMAAIMLQPYMPNKANMMLDQLGVHESRRTFEYCGVGLDLNYGTPLVDLGVRHEGLLFPPLPSDE